jgi:hypothetical protein
VKNPVKQMGVLFPPSAPFKNLSIANKELSETTALILSQLRHSKISDPENVSFFSYLKA